MLPPRAMGTSRPKLQLLIMSGSVIPPELWSMFMSLACITTEGHVNSVLNHVLK